MPWSSSRRLAGLALVMLACSSSTRSDDDSGSVSADSGSAGESTSTSSVTTPATTDGADASSAGADESTGAKFDLPQPDGGGSCKGGEGELEFSNIWIANSQEGTVTKIDTLTRVEIGRYDTGPAGQHDPSRTSVNLDGDVAVVNREGGITKIVARFEDCVDTDGDGSITTSSGANDVKPWGEDECVVWNTPLPTRSRPVAWTAGEGTACTGHENQKVWAAAPMGNDGIVYLLDGDSGVIEAEVVIPDIAPADFDPVYHGVYGGAVDANDDFWGCVKSAEPWLVHVRFDDQTFEKIPVPLATYYPSYGMTVGADGFVWVGGLGAVQRYDPATGDWAPVTNTLPDAWFRGMMVDDIGNLWVAVVDQSGGIIGSQSGLARIDTEDLQMEQFITDFGGMTIQEATGVSIDVDGDVWIVGQFSNGVFVHDPSGNRPPGFVGGLVGPYTYSDMTGWALRHVAGPEG